MLFNNPSIKFLSIKFHHHIVDIRLNRDQFHYCYWVPTIWAWTQHFFRVFKPTATLFFILLNRQIAEQRAYLYQVTRKSTSSYFLSASSARKRASFNWFSRASIRSSSDNERFSNTLRALHHFHRCNFVCVGMKIEKKCLKISYRCEFDVRKVLIHSVVVVVVVAALILKML